ncbi:serine/threonine-protein kinase [Enhygromyxa salina]|uniref:Serine/threonine-protein kinase PrkC n=1 Tax=Enhygromyxa salina TaxID=215803 RepID=A0A2S9YFK9_9BACT|nr:serine/threonine-protein kinase [Enhygromyxa salina]PRQ03796.1 Serine/threonine-protein kinase PrkC [Enhygromyxa salina]
MPNRTSDETAPPVGDLDAFERARVKSIAARGLFGAQSAERVTLGQYEQIELVAEGGMGRVYRAHDSRLQRTVALKLVRPDRSDTVGAEALLAEARAAVAVPHPNVVDVYEVGESAGLVYIAMQFIAGASLDRWVESDQAALPSLLRGLLTIASALAAAHRNDVVHRDIKPRNILIADDGGFYLGDFGLAEIWRTSVPDPSSEESTRSVGGTPLFVAPELLDGGDATPASDIFSLGVTIFRSVYARPPFPGTTSRWVAAGAEQPSCPRRGRFGLVPRALRHTVARMLAIDPSARPSVEQVVATLETVCQAPATRRRATLGLGLTLAFAAAVAARPGPRPQHLCAAAGQPVLSEAELRALGLHLQRLERPFAASTAAAADAFFRRENEAAIQAGVAECERDADRGLARALFAEDSCLAREVEALRALHASLLDIDAERLGQIAPLLARLEVRGDCEAAPQLGTRFDPAQAARLSDLRDRLQRFDTLFELTASGEAADQARALWTEAQAQGDALTRAWAGVLAGRAAARVGEVETAEAALEAAFTASLEAGSSLWAARALTQIVWVDASLREHPNAATRVAQLGLGYARQVGDRERAALLEVELLDYVSTALDLAGEPERAESSSRQALAMLLALDGPHVVQEARVRANLAVVLSNLDRNAESVVESEAAYDVLARAYGETHPHVVSVLNNLALQRLIANDLAGARRDFERALALKAHIYGRAHPSSISTRLGLAGVAESQGAIEEALSQLEAARAIAELAVEAGASSRQLEAVCYERARVSLNAGRLEDAGAAIERSLALERAREPSGAWVTSDLLHLRILRAQLAPRFAAALAQVRDQVQSGALRASEWEQLYLEFLGLSVELSPCHQADDPQLRAFLRRLEAEPDPGELADDVQAWLSC